MILRTITVVSLCKKKLGTPALKNFFYETFSGCSWLAKTPSITDNCIIFAAILFIALVKRPIIPLKKGSKWKSLYGGTGSQSWRRALHGAPDQIKVKLVSGRREGPRWRGRDPGWGRASSSATNQLWMQDRTGHITFQFGPHREHSMLPLQKPLHDCRVRKELLLVVRITQGTYSVRKKCSVFFKPSGRYTYHQALNIKIAGISAIFSTAAISFISCPSTP